jgi:hypothetical protein
MQFGFCSSSARDTQHIMIPISEVEIACARDTVRGPIHGKISVGTRSDDPDVAVQRFYGP